MKELVEVIAKSLVDSPEEVVVTETEENDAILLELKVAPADMGKVIGRQGRIAKAIRTVVKAASSKGEKKVVILKFRDVDNINDIEPYKGKSLYVTRDFAVPLEENEYYIADLIDMDVFLEDGSLFGTLKDVMETGANDVYVIHTTDKKEVLVPAIKDCVKEVDVEQNKMIIHLLKGLC